MKKLISHSSLIEAIRSSCPDVEFQRLQESGIMQEWMTSAIQGSPYEGQMANWSMDQNSSYHQLTLEGHTLQVLKNSLKYHANAPLEKQIIMRLTAICHDMGKMYRGIHKIKPTGLTSYPGHEIHSAILTGLFLNFLGLSEYIPHVKPLVRHHMRPHDLVKGASPKAIRKLLNDLSTNQVQWQDLLDQAAADATAKSTEWGPKEDEYLHQLSLLKEQIIEIERLVQSCPCDKKGPQSLT